MAVVNVSFKGLKELTRRVEALDDLGGFMRDLALTAVSEQKQLAPVKTGNLRRSIRVGRVTTRSAETIAGADYAAHVEFGTRPHEIRPRTKSVLRFKVGTRTVYARRVRHPGTKARPYMIPGAERAIAGARGLKERLIERWNRAA